MAARLAWGVWALFALSLLGAASASSWLRYMSANIGNVSPPHKCKISKMCEKEAADNVRSFIAEHKPDVVLLTEVCQSAQLKGSVNCKTSGSEMSGPLLPEGYDGICGKSEFRDGRPAGPFDEGASHEFECIAWKTSRVKQSGATASLHFGENCNYDFTAFRAELTIDSWFKFSAIIAHPPSGMARMLSGFKCDMDASVQKIWKEFIPAGNVIAAGDWNTPNVHFEDLGKPKGFQINYSNGQYWDFENISGVIVKAQKLDHAFSNFGRPRTVDFPLGAAVSGHRDGEAAKTFYGMKREKQIDSHCGGKVCTFCACDHPAVLVDMWLPRKK